MAEDRLGFYPGIKPVSFESTTTPRSTGRVVSGVGDTVEEAWDRFEDSLRDLLFWFRGNKYWRAVPRLRRVPFYDEFGNYIRDQWSIAGRVTVTTGESDDLVPVGFEHD